MASELWLQIRTCNRYAHQHGDGLRALHEAPGAGEVPRFHPFHREHLEGVQEATQTYAIQPNEQHVSVVTLHSAQRQQRHSCKSNEAVRNAGTKAGSYACAVARYMITCLPGPISVSLLNQQAVGSTATFHESTARLMRLSAVRKSRKVVEVFYVHGTVHLSNTEHINANEMQLMMDAKGVRNM